MRLGPRGVLTLSALVILTVAFVISRPHVASAHPLGNFTINRYSRIEPGAGQIRLVYVLDMAEVPTFQEMSRIDLDRDGQISDTEHTAYLTSKAEELRNALYLSINNRRMPLNTVSQELSFPPGQGGLPTLRLSQVLQTPREDTNSQEEQALYFRDDNYPDRLGWKEIIVKVGEGVSLIRSTASQQDQSDELRTYPKDMLRSPLNLVEARATFVATGLYGPNEAQGGRGIASPTAKSKDLLSSLVTTEKLSPMVILLSLMVALGLGALHAASPGHGKSIMAAYIVSTRGTPKQIVFLGFTVTASHTLGVLALGLVVLYASHLIAPERLYPWLSLITGLTVLAIGLWLVAARLRGHRAASQPHHHTHPHQPSPGGSPRTTWKSLAALGIAGGLLPSASALVLLLAALSMHRIGFGLLLILAFGAGMAAALTGVGMLIVYAGRTMERFRWENPLIGGLTRLLPLGTAMVVLALGLAASLRALFQTGLL